jgi:hypothetical protein
MEIQDLAIPMVSTATGGISVLFVSKLLLQSWMRRYDDLQKTVSQVDKDVAVLNSKIQDMKNDINNIGALLRKGRS